MTETKTGRRRWLWGLVAVVLILVALPVVPRFWPLTATERRLLGTWHIAYWPEFDSPRDSLYRLEPQGRATTRNLTDPCGGETVCTWSASENRFWLRVDLQGRDRMRWILSWWTCVLQGISVTPGYQELEFLSEDEVRVTHGGIYGTSLWKRVAREPE